MKATGLFIRFLHRLYRLAAALRFRVERHLTPAGLGVLAVSFALAGVGTDTDRSLAPHTWIAGLAILAAGFVGSRGFKGAFTVTRRLPRFATTGVPVHYSLTLRNDSINVFCGGDLVERSRDERMTLTEFAQQCRLEERKALFRRTQPAISGRRLELKRTPLGPVPAGASVELSMTLVPLRRGTARMVGCDLGSIDPLGVYRSVLQTGHPSTLVVLPRILRIPNLKVGGGRGIATGTGNTGINAGDSGEFRSLRDYRPGDPLRRVHWRSWARTGRPVIRDFLDESRARLAVLLDTFADPDGATAAIFEDAVTVAASLTAAIAEGRETIRLVGAGTQMIRAGSGAEPGMRLPTPYLERLANVSLEGASGIHHWMAGWLPEVSRLDVAWLVLLEWDPTRQAIVEQLCRLGLHTQVCLVTRADGGPPRLNPGAANLRLAGFHVVRAGFLETDLRRLGRRCNEPESSRMGVDLGGVSP